MTTFRHSSPYIKAWRGITAVVHIPGQVGPIQLPTHKMHARTTHKYAPQHVPDCALRVAWQTIEDPIFPSIADDIAMMNALGVKIVIVAGNRFQLERNLRIRGVPLRKPRDTYPCRSAARWDSEHSAWGAPAGIRRSPAVSGRPVRGCEADHSRQIRILGSRTRPLFAWCVYTLRTYATDQC